jgi:hypothetical protein
MNNKALQDIKYELDKRTFEVAGEDVVKVEDILSILENMLEDGEDIVSKDKVKEALDQVIRENYNRILNELWEGIENKLDN